MLGKTNSAGSTPNLIEKNIFDNGTYVAENDNADGYSQVTVALPLGEKSIISNGEYLASADDLKGFTKVTVNVPAQVPALGTKNITANGTYNAGSDNLDGYSQVIVSVPQPKLYSPSVAYENSLGYNISFSKNYDNGKFGNGFVFTAQGVSVITDFSTEDFEFYQGYSDVSSWHIFEVLPLVGGDIELSVSLWGNDFVNSDPTIATYKWATATKTNGYISVSNLGNSSSSAQVYTYDENFPRVFEEVMDTEGNKFVKIPTIYRSVTITGVQITAYKLSLTKIDSTYEPYPCFVDEVTEDVLPYILIGKYCISSTISANSVNATPANLSISNARTLCQAKGNGYQQYDWKIRQLVVDLGVALSRLVDIASGTGPIPSVMGICHADKNVWVDGIIKGSSEYPNAWYLCDYHGAYYSPSSTLEAQANILSHGYYKLSYNAPANASTSQVISVVGYDSEHKFCNLPNSVQSAGSNHHSYYCSGIKTTNFTYAVYSNIGSVQYTYYGWWNMLTNDFMTPIANARLCYRPIAEPSAEDWEIQGDTAEMTNVDIVGDTVEIIGDYPEVDADTVLI